jgi:uncharacterized membrane protein (UPF0182 family)
MVALGAAAVLLVAGRALAGVYADYLWYDALGATALWRTRLAALSALRIGSGAAAALFAFANLYAVRQSVVSLVFPRRLGNLEIGEEVPGRYLLIAAGALAILLGAVLAVPQTDWMSLVLAQSGRSFSEIDPYFGANLGFFVYWLPFESALWSWAFVCIIVVSATVILLYALTPSLKWQRGGLYASAYVRRHVTVLVGVLLLMLAWSFRLDMYSLLMDGSGPDGAFGYVDRYVGIPGDVLLSLATLGAAVVVIWAGSVGQLRLAGISVLTVVALSLVAREIAPLVAQHIGSDADRAARERSYGVTRALYTRSAYGVNGIHAADSSIVYPSLAAAMPWVPVWDPPALARAIDAGRAGDDRNIRTSWRATPAGMIGEVIDPPAPGAAPRAPWTVARVLAAEADERGAPMRVAGPSSSATDDTPLDAPLVYPGASEFVTIPDSLSHSAGTPLASFWTRLASAWSLQNLHILSGDLPQPKPTIIAHRDIRERVERLAPFFAQGRHVAPVLVGDSLYWALDLYAVSSTYPLSQHALLAGDDRSYLKHAAVAIVQASTGDISVVPDSALDPIATTWVKRLPTIFGTWNALPVGLRSLLPPPVDGLYAQANAFGRYGIESDIPRHVPTLDGSDTSLATGELPIALPGASTTALALPLVDDTDRLRGLLVGTGGSTPTTMWYPLTTPGPRWSAMLDRLRSVDSAGSAAREGPLARGRVRAVPVRNGIGFLQPTYRWRPQSVPTLSRVIVLDGDSTKSLAPGTTMVAQRPDSLPGHAESRTTAAALYAAMRDALRRGDWAAFGRAFEALGRTLGVRPTP